MPAAVSCMSVRADGLPGGRDVRQRPLEGIRTETDVRDLSEAAAVSANDPDRGARSCRSHMQRHVESTDHANGSASECAPTTFRELPARGPPRARSGFAEAAFCPCANRPLEGDRSDSPAGWGRYVDRITADTPRPSISPPEVFWPQPRPTGVMTSDRSGGGHPLGPLRVLRRSRNARRGAFDKKT
jgi:hypothetical protein